MPEHKDLTGVDLHEPKGVATADAKQMYFADGAGSGNWLHHGGSCHGEMVIEGNTVATVTPYPPADATLNTDTDFVKITPLWIAGHAELVTFSTDELIVGVSGSYEVHFWCDIKIPAANQRVAIKYAVNDSTPYSTRKLVVVSASTNDTLNLAGSGIIGPLTAGDTISIYIATDKAGDPIVEEAGLLIKLLDQS